jgi:hypothetical protein
LHHEDFVGTAIVDEEHLVGPGHLRYPASLVFPAVYSCARNVLTFTGFGTGIAAALSNRLLVVARAAASPAKNYHEKKSRGPCEPPVLFNAIIQFDSFMLLILIHISLSHPYFF